jgi:glycosyltransferase involved in cell wall biosynthesis
MINNKLAYVGGGGMIVKKKAAEQVNYLDENYAPAWFEDTDFCYELRKAGYTIGYHPNPNIEHLGHRTVHDQDDFDSQKAWNKSHQYFLKKWHNKPKEKFFATKGRKPRINIMVDVKGWAWWNKAIQLKKWLSDDFDIEIVFGDDHDCDLFFSFERDRPKDYAIKYISGITAHVWNNIPNFKKTMIEATAIHANSILLFNEVKHLNCNCYYIPNGVDEKQFYFKERDITKPFTVGYVGKDHPRKGLRNIIIPACENAGVELKIQACRFDSKNKIDHSNMPDFYHDIDCVMIASNMDGTPNMLLEAASCGRTFIGNIIGNVPEFWNGERSSSDDLNGVMFTGSVNVQTYTSLLKELKKNRKKCQKMGIMARKEIEKGWTWKIQAENYRKMFWGTI